MTQANLETVYEAMARAVDAVGPAQAELYLAKLALALADELGDADRALAAIAECQAGLEAG